MVKAGLAGLTRIGVRVVARAVDGGLEVVQETVDSLSTEAQERIKRSRATAQGIGRVAEKPKTRFVKVEVNPTTDARGVEVEEEVS